jgi:hypothetical protein
LGDLAEMIEVTPDVLRHQILGGRHPARQASGYFLADSQGKSVEAAAAIMVRDIMLYGMKIAEGSW